MRNPHSGVSGGGLQTPYQPASFSLHQKPEFLAYTDFSTSCLVPAPHAAYPRDDRLYQEPHGGGFQHADWQFPVCESRGRGQEACPGGPVAVGGCGGEMDSVGGDRLPGGAAPGGLEGEYSPQSVASSAETEKKSSKRKRDTTGECV